MDDPEARYRAIMRRIAARKNNPSRPPTTPDGILDDLNAFDALDDLRQRLKLCDGPKVVRGKGWTGVVIWCRQRGYSTRPTLTLLGVWAVARTVIVGRKSLPFTAPVYTAEAYHRLIKRSFKTYHDDDGSPPPQHLWRARYDSAERLKLREALVTALARLARSL